jgi:hypothetical protein
VLGQLLAVELAAAAVSPSAAAFRGLRLRPQQGQDAKVRVLVSEPHADCYLITVLNYSNFDVAFASPFLSNMLFVGICRMLVSSVKATGLYRLGCSLAG